MSAAVATPPPVQPAATPATVTPPPATPAGPPTHIATAELWRLSRADYRKMCELGVLKDGDPVELLDGLLVRKMPKNRPHVIACRRTQLALSAVLPAGWSVTYQDPVALDESEPEPDITVLRGQNEDYTADHPTPADTPLVVEVSHTTLHRDRNWKRSIYARNGIATYWIVNLVDRVLEVYTAPAGGDYTQTATLTAADRADVVLDGATVGTVAVADLLP